MVKEIEFASLVAQGTPPRKAVEQVLPDAPRPGRTANEMMRHPDVLDYLDRMRKRAIKSTELKPEYILGQLVKIAMTAEKDADRLTALKALSEHVGMASTYTSASQIVEAFSKAFGAELGKKVAERLGVDITD